MRRTLEQRPAAKAARNSLSPWTFVAMGAALATNMGSTNCSDYTMVGDAINIAARLQGKAARGEVLLTEDAYKTTERGSS